MLRGPNLDASRAVAIVFERRKEGEGLRAQVVAARAQSGV